MGSTSNKNALVKNENIQTCRACELWREVHVPSLSALKASSAADMIVRPDGKSSAASSESAGTKQNDDEAMNW
jgi:hypothetical protein